MAEPLPHEGVLVRLGVSRIDGIGVFAIKPIAAGTMLFATDSAPIRWVSKAALGAADLSDAEARLYRDFGISRGEVIGCPADFHHLTPGWYLNEPVEGEEPNVTAAEDFTFRASRDIEAGEELTVRYLEFSEASA